MNSFLQQSIKLSPDVMARRVGNEIFILSVKSECYFGLDEVGARMFALLTEGTSVGDTLRQLEVEYAADLNILQRDLEGLIAELARHQLIEIVTSPEP
jgi:hypothetical protein